MENNWYVVKVLPGKERSLNDFFNKEISLGKIKNINRFICPTEKEFVARKNKKILREKIIYSGYLYFEATDTLSDDDLKEIAGMPNIMAMMGDKTPLKMRQSDISKILKDENLENHLESKKIKYTIGEEIKVTEGPFTSFNGTISKIEDDKIMVEIKIFGRNNLVSLNLSQITKI